MNGSWELDYKAISFFFFVFCLAVNALGVYFNWKIVYLFGIPVLRRSQMLKQAIIPRKYDYPGAIAGAMSEQVIFDFDSKHDGYFHLRRRSFRGLKFVIGRFFIRDRRLDVHARISLFGVLAMISFCFFTFLGVRWDFWAVVLAVALVVGFPAILVRETLAMRQGAEELVLLLEDPEA